MCIIEFHKNNELQVSLPYNFPITHTLCRVATIEQEVIGVWFWCADIAPRVHGKQYKGKLLDV